MNDIKYYTPDELRAVHGHSSNHFKEIQASKLCGCFYCCLVFAPQNIKQWLEEPNAAGKTASCPHCGMDSVVGSNSEYPVSESEFLNKMHDYWFE
jgi:hypothetical protein